MKALLYLLLAVMTLWAAIRLVLWLWKERDLERERHYSEWNGNDD